MDFSKAADRRHTNSIKWDSTAIENISSNPDAEPFWVADMDFPTDPHIAETGRKVAETGIYGYPSFPLLTAKASEWQRKKHGWDVPAEDISFAMGLLHGIASCMDLFTQKGDTILVPTPAYRPFREITENQGRVMVDHELGYDHATASFYLDRERFRRDAEKSKCILFCSPHNPSGIVFSEEELRFVLETAKELGILVISDEIHSDLVHPGKKHIPMNKVNESIGADCITLFAPSKTFNIAGEHSAFIVFSSDKMRDEFRKREHAMRLDEPSIVIGELASSAYEHGLEYNNELCAYLGDNVRKIDEFLKASGSGMKMVNAEASFVAFLDCIDVYDKVKAEVEAHPEKYTGGKGGGILSRFFGVNASVAVNDGTWFGDQWGRFVRFNYGTSIDRVLGGLTRMTEALKAL